MVALRARASVSDTPVVMGGSGSVGAAGSAGFVVVLTGVVNRGARWQAAVSRASATAPALPYLRKRKFIGRNQRERK